MNCMPRSRLQPLRSHPSCRPVECCNPCVASSPVPRSAVSCFPGFLIAVISASSAVSVGKIIGCSQLTAVLGHYMALQYMASPVPDRELKKGSAELMILALLEDRPRHGYEIGQLIGLRSR